MPEDFVRDILRGQMSAKGNRSRNGLQLWL